MSCVWSEYCIPLAHEALLKHQHFSPSLVPPSLPGCDTRMIVYLTRLVVFPEVAVIKTGDKVKQLPELVLVESGRGNNSQPRHTLGV